MIGKGSYMAIYVRIPQQKIYPGFIDKKYKMLNLQHLLVLRDYKAATQIGISQLKIIIKFKS